jgi:hypothetical protein
MELERRDFLKAVTSGLALGCTNGIEAVGRNSRSAITGELLTGSGTLHLKGKLKSGELALDAHDFLDRTSQGVVVRGKLDPSGSKSVDLYSAMFNHQNDLRVFAVFQDSDHLTTAVLSNSDDPKIGRLVVWNDNETPQIHNIDKNNIMNTEDVKGVKDLNGKVPDLLGKRKAAVFTWRELEDVFGSDQALLAFMRGKKAKHQPPEGDILLEWVCHYLSMVPGSLLSLFWEA